MKNKILILTILLTVVLSSFLTGCGEDADRVTINVYNWGEYIDEEVIRDFEKTHNIRVNYDTFATNEEMYVKVKSGSSKYDVL